MTVKASNAAKCHGIRNGEKKNAPGRRDEHMAGTIDGRHRQYQTSDAAHHGGPVVEKRVAKRAQRRAALNGDDRLGGVRVASQEKRGDEQREQSESELKQECTGSDKAVLALEAEPCGIQQCRAQFRETARREKSERNRVSDILVPVEFMDAVIWHARVGQQFLRLPFD